MDTTQAWAKISDVASLTFQGKPGGYAFEIARECVDSIVRAYNRREPLKPEERDAIAEQIVVNFSFLTIFELKDFESKLTSGLIGVNVGGQTEYKMLSVDRASIMERLRIYAAPKAPKEEVFKPQDTHPGISYPMKCESDPYMQTHNLQGEEMPEGWNWRAYWAALPTKEDEEELERRAQYRGRVRGYYEELKTNLGRRYGEMLRAGNIEPYPAYRAGV